MLDLLKNYYKLNNNNKKSLNLPKIKKGNRLGFRRDFPSSILSWYNSIYSFDKKIEKSVLPNHILVNKLIKMYYSLIFINLGKRNRRRYKYNNIKKVFASRTYIKHINNKVTITLFTYKANKRQFKNILSSYNNLLLNKNFKANFLKKKHYLNYKCKKLYKFNNNLYKNYLYKGELYKKVKDIFFKYNIIFKNFFYYSKLFKKTMHKNNIYKFDILFKYSILKYKKLFYNIVKDSFMKEIKYLKYFQSLMYDRFKYNNVFLNRIKNLINKIYNKKVELNIIKLKYPYLNLHIFTDIIFSKLERNFLKKKTHKSRRKRMKKPLFILKKASKRPRLKFSNLYEYNIRNYYINKFNSLNIDDIYSYNNKNNNNKKDILNTILNNIFILKNTNYLNKLKDLFVYRSVKFRKVRGIKLELKGRINRRFTASRSIKKKAFEGGFRNVYSSIDKIPSVLLKGHMHSNIQYSNINWATRRGAYGFRGWLASK